MGDPVVVRTLVAGTNDVHTWHLDGHWFRIEPYSRTSPPVNTVHLGISERFDLVIPRPAVPRAGRATISTTAVASSSCGKAAGACYGSARPAPQALCGPCPGARRLHPGRRALPQEAPRKEFAVVAVSLPLPMLGGSRGVAYVLEQDRAAVLAGGRPPQPLAPCERRGLPGSLATERDRRSRVPARRPAGL